MQLSFIILFVIYSATASIFNFGDQEKSHTVQLEGLHVNEPTYDSVSEGATPNAPHEVYSSQRAEPAVNTFENGLDFNVKNTAKCARMEYYYEQFNNLSTKLHTERKEKIKKIQNYIDKFIEIIKEIYNKIKKWINEIEFNKEKAIEYIVGFGYYLLFMFPVILLIALCQYTPFYLLVVISNLILLIFFNNNSLDFIVTLVVAIRIIINIVAGNYSGLILALLSIFITYHIRPVAAAEVLNKQNKINYEAINEVVSWTRIVATSVEVSFIFIMMIGLLILFIYLFIIPKKEDLPPLRYEFVKFRFKSNEDLINQVEKEMDRIRRLTTDWKLFDEISPQYDAGEGPHTFIINREIENRLRELRESQVDRLEKITQVEEEKTKLVQAYRVGITDPTFKKDMNWKNKKGNYLDYTDYEDGRQDEDVNANLYLGKKFDMMFKNHIYKVGLDRTREWRTSWETSARKLFSSISDDEIRFRIMQDILFVYEQVAKAIELGKIEIGDCRPVQKRTVTAVVTKIYSVIVTVFEQDIGLVTPQDENNVITGGKEVEKTVFTSKEMWEELRTKMISTGKLDFTVNDLLLMMKNCGRYLLTDEEYADAYLHIVPKFRYQVLKEMNEAELANSRYNKASERKIELGKHAKRARFYWRNLKMYYHSMLYIPLSAKLIWMFSLILPLLLLLVIAESAIRIGIRSPLVSDKKSDKELELHEMKKTIYGQNDQIETQGAVHKMKKYKKIKNVEMEDEETVDIVLGTMGRRPVTLQAFSQKSKTNMESALKHRNLVKPEGVHIDKIKLQYHANKLADKFLERNPDFTDNPVSYSDIEAFVNGRPQYDANMKKRILEEVRKIQSQDQLFRLGKKMVDTFIKYEYYPENKRPRNIMVCDLAVRGIVGAILENLNKRFFTQPETIKHVTITARPQYIEEYFGDAQYIYQTDYSHFESAQDNNWIKNGEMIFMKKVMPYHYKLLEAILAPETRTVRLGQRGENQGVWEIPNMRMSGFPDTSLGNTLHNMIMLEIVSEETQTKMKYLVEGDDGLIVAEKPLDVNRVLEITKNYGIELKIEQRDMLRTAGFLSTIWDEDRILDVTDRAKYMRMMEIFREDKINKIGLIPLLKARLISALINSPKSQGLYLLSMSLENLYPRVRAKMEKNFWSFYELVSLGLSVTSSSDQELVIEDFTAYQFAKHDKFKEDSLQYGMSEESWDILWKKMNRNLLEWIEAYDYIIDIYDTKDQEEYCYISEFTRRINQKQMVGKIKLTTPHNLGFKNFEEENYTIQF